MSTLPTRGTTSRVATFATPTTSTVKKVLSPMFSKPVSTSGRRIMLYGAGGVGKTTLASTIPGMTAFIDLDGSLGVLGGPVQERIAKGEVVVVGTSSGKIETWKELLDVLSAPGWDSVKNIVIDTLTMAEEMAVRHTLETHPVNGRPADSVESYGFGKGYTYIFEEFMKLLPVLEKHTTAGRNVILVCHDCQRTVANPSGADYLRFEPRLQDPSSGKSSVRLRMREWCDDVLFDTLDISVDEQHKASGGNSRTVYPSDRLWCMAKSRTVTEPIYLDDFVDFWKKLNLDK